MKKFINKWKKDAMFRGIVIFTVFALIYFILCIFGWCQTITAIERMNLQQSENDEKITKLEEEVSKPNYDCREFYGKGLSKGEKTYLSQKCSIYQNG